MSFVWYPCFSCVRFFRFALLPLIISSLNGMGRAHFYSPFVLKYTIHVFVFVSTHLAGSRYVVRRRCMDFFYSLYTCTYKRTPNVPRCSNKPFIESFFLLVFSCIRVLCLCTLFIAYYHYYFEYRIIVLLPAFRYLYRHDLVYCFFRSERILNLLHRLC